MSDFLKTLLRNAKFLVGAGLFGLCPPIASAAGDGINSVYVESGDAALLYEGQLPPGSVQTVNPFEERLGSSLERFQREWSSLPNIAIPSGKTLTIGATGRRVALLRQRLGLSAGGQRILSVS